MARSSLENIELVVRTIAQTSIDNEKYFTELDGVVGDGDFGTSLESGFGAILSQWDKIDRSSGESFLLGCAKIISRNIGGTSGSIWRAAFRSAGKSISDKEMLTAEDVVTMFRAAADGIMDRGGANLGDKTLLDALVPAADAFEQTIANGGNTQEAIDAAAKTAREQAEITKAWVAKRGRASYTGERSKDTYDAGAVAVAVMFENVATAWAKF
ncbi:MAG: dihydroxyacetone kinase subunit L [Okeania sp. SIO3B5]|uniref:dihydroxyacetone kinase subunit DhaL n=1 Tax=Okeania sp. SIO3B5 TaxID=2607811 RepID=UPI0013FFFEDC|nr:dihydroxyacetone kinase subunit DhaL [Okeania sp. SIO3B5]NEO52941.1 dihydroxyacetone kinase subunit L [Okeania sp. SIO3B5]